MTLYLSHATVITLLTRVAACPFIMGFSTSTLLAVVVHMIGIWALSHLYRAIRDEGILHTLNAVTGHCDGRKTIGDMVPKGILGLELEFLSRAVQFAFAVLYSAYLLLMVYRWTCVPSDSVHHFNTRDTGHHVAPGTVGSRDILVICEASIKVHSLGLKWLSMSAK